MRILVVSDIHANWSALRSIQEPFDVCFCLGDLVDYGPEPGPCVSWVMTHATHAIRGNHDHGVAQGVSVEGETGFRYLTRVTRPMQWPALNEKQRRYLLQMPLTRRVTVEGKRFFLVHGTPRDPLDEYVMNDPETWERRLDGIDADFVCVGHTHAQFSIKVGSVTLLNPGSIGLPRDGDPRAAYAIIENGRVELKRLAYPIDETISRLAESPIPERARDMLATGLRTGRLVPSTAAEPAGKQDATSQGQKLIVGG